MGRVFEGLLSTVGGKTNDLFLLLFPALLTAFKVNPTVVANLLHSEFSEFIIS